MNDIEKCRNASGRRDLQLLVEALGGYHKITPEAWAQWDAMMGAYRARMTTISPIGSERATRIWRPYSEAEECCDCHALGVFGYSAESLRRMGCPDAEPDEMFWFCGKHMLSKHFADARRT